MKKHLLKTLIAAGALGLAAGPLHAQTNFPTKPIRLVVPLSPGGGGDIVARTLAAEMNAILGQPMIVENKAGGSTIIGTADVVKSEPDGYTLVMATSSHVINPAVRELPFDAAKDFEGVSLIATTPALLVANPSLAANTVPELIALAKSKPGALTFGSSGIASSPHLSGEMFKLRAEVDIRHVPYKGMGPALNDLVGGHVDMVFSSPVSALPLVQSGKLKAIATTGTKRTKMFSDVPTVGETLPGYQSEIFYLILAPKGTPKPVVQKLSDAFAKAATNPAFVDRIMRTGGEVVAGSPALAYEFLESQISGYKDLVKRADIKVK